VVCVILNAYEAIQSLVLTDDSRQYMRVYCRYNLEVLSRDGFLKPTCGPGNSEPHTFATWLLSTKIGTRACCSAKATMGNNKTVSSSKQALFFCFLVIGSPGLTNPMVSRDIKGRKIV
jgi:hypothetical protein